MGDRPDPSRLDGDGPALADAPGLLSRLLIQLAHPYSRGETLDERADADLPLLAEAKALQARLAAR